MKKIPYTSIIAVSFFVIYALVSPFVVYSQTASPSAKPSLTIVPTIDKSVQQLKEKVASKVAELQKKEQKAVTGVVDKIEGSVITLTSANGEKVTVTIDDVITKLYEITGTSQREVEATAYTKGDYLIAIGPQIDGSITANSIYKDEQYQVGSGNITEVNQEDFYFRVLSDSKQALTFDVETSTRVNMMNIKTFELERSGFSKLKEGDTIHFVYKITGEEREKDRYSASRLIVVPQEYFIK